MAEILDISVKHYSEVERGITGLSVEKLIYLSQLFNVTLDYLLKGEGKPADLPCILANAYRACPDEKKSDFIDLIKSLGKLLENS